MIDTDRDEVRRVFRAVLDEQPPIRISPAGIRRRATRRRRHRRALRGLLAAGLLVAGAATVPAWRQGPADPVQPATTTAPPTTGRVQIPSVSSLGPTAAAAKLTAAGLTPVVVDGLFAGESDVVIQQSPLAGTFADVGTEVWLGSAGGRLEDLMLFKVRGEFYYSLDNDPRVHNTHILGRVTSRAATGTAPVHRFACTSSSCGGQHGSYYSMSGEPPPGGTWRDTGVSFHAYPEQRDPRMLAVRALAKGQRWVWVVGPDIHNQVFFDRGYTERFVVGWIWPAEAWD